MSCFAALRSEPALADAGPAAVAATAVTAARVVMVRLVLMFVSPVWGRLSVRCLARSSGCRAMGAGGLAPAEQRGDAIDGGEAHEAVDDPRRRVRRSEFL